MADAMFANTFGGPLFAFEHEMLIFQAVFLSTIKVCNNNLHLW